MIARSKGCTVDNARTRSFQLATEEVWRVAAVPVTRFIKYNIIATNAVCELALRIMVLRQAASPGLWRQ